MLADTKMIWPKKWYFILETDRYHLFETDTDISGDNIGGHLLPLQNSNLRIDRSSKGQLSADNIGEPIYRSVSNIPQTSLRTAGLFGQTFECIRILSWEQNDQNYFIT